MCQIQHPGYREPEFEVTDLDIALDCPPGPTGSLQSDAYSSGQAIGEGAGWRVDKGGWQESGTTVSGLAADGAFA